MTFDFLCHASPPTYMLQYINLYSSVYHLVYSSIFPYCTLEEQFDQAKILKQAIVDLRKVPRKDWNYSSYLCQHSYSVCVCRVRTVYSVNICTYVHVSWIALSAGW